MQAHACADGKPCTSSEASPVGQWLWQGVVLVHISLVQRDPHLWAGQLTELQAAALALSAGGGRSALDRQRLVNADCDRCASHALQARQLTSLPSLSAAGGRFSTPRKAPAAFSYKGFVLLSHANGDRHVQTRHVSLQRLLLCRLSVCVSELGAHYGDRLLVAMRSQAMLSEEV